MPTEFRSRLILAGVVLVLLVAAFSAGRFSAPREVEVVEKEKLVYFDQFVTKSAMVDLSVRKERQVVTRRTVITPDAGTVIDERIETGGTTENHIATNTESDRKTSMDRENYKATTTTNQPKWRVTAQVGVAMGDPKLPLAGPLVVGAEVDYRIAGGVSAGVWGNTVGAAGVAVSLEF
jgi:hypothetical protein